MRPALNYFWMCTDFSWQDTFWLALLLNSLALFTLLLGVKTGAGGCLRHAAEHCQAERELAARFYFFKFKKYRKCPDLKIILKKWKTARRKGKMAFRKMKLTFNLQSWALSVFLKFFNNKKWYFGIFYQANNLFLHQSYLQSPLPVKLTW